MNSFTAREKKILGLFLTVMILLHFVHLPQFKQDAANITARGGHQTEAHAPNHFGAIAISDSGLIYGTSYDYDTPAEAEQSAVSYCRKGNRLVDCQAVLTFADTCAAIAIKASSAKGKYDGGWGVAYDASTRKAEADAVAACVKAAGGNCKVDYSYCSKAK